MRQEQTFSLPDGQTLTHHGDVVARKIDKLPEGLKKISPRPIALGEFSGHRHVVTCERENLIDFYEDDKGNVYVTSKEPMTLRHSLENGEWTREHHTITLVPQVWKFSIQRVRDPFTETINSVQD